MDSKELERMQRDFWLNFFNEYLFEHGKISQDVKNHISNLINEVL